MNEIVSNLRGVSLFPECWDVMKKKTRDPPLTAWVALRSCYSPHPLVLSPEQSTDFFSLSSVEALTPLQSFQLFLFI